MPEPFDIFGEDIAGLIGEHLSEHVFDLTLTVVTPGTRGVNPTAGTQPTTADHTVKGWEDSYSERQVDGQMIQQGDRKISILGSSLPSGVVPKPNDEITLAGVTRTICENGVKTDPAHAVFECQCR